MKLFSLKNKKLIVTALVVVVLGLVIGQAAWGADGGTGNQAPSKLTEVLANIFFYISAALGWLLTFVLGVLLKVAKYNDFLNQAAVTQGWIIVRDICNNFFIVVLLVIAVGTALGVPNYHYKNLLPKLLVMAVLINFSKMFAGIMIDFAQVVMLSFANPLAEADGQAIILAAMNLPAAYNAGDIAISMTGKEYNIFNVLVAMLFALIVSVVALVVIVVIMIVLVYRIVMLWFLVILSPAAFFLSTFPKGQQYSGQWWSMMAKYLVVGPVMVFFLYLSLFTMANIVDKRDSIAAMSDETEVPGLQAIPGQPETSVNGEKRELSFSDLGSEQGVFNFAIIIGLLVGSLVMGQQAGVAGSKWAGKGIGALQKMGKGAAGMALRNVGGAATKVASATRLPLVSQWAGDVNKKNNKNAKKRRISLMNKMGMGEGTKEWLANRGKGTEYTARSIGALGGLASGAVIGATSGMSLGPGGVLFGGILGGALGGVLGWGRNLGGHTIEAAKDESRDLKNAKLNMENARKYPSWFKEASASTFYSSSGQTTAQKKFFDQLALPANEDVRRNIAGAITRADINKEGEVGKLRAIARGIAAQIKGGHKGPEFEDIIREIDLKAAMVGDPTELDTVNSYDASVIAASRFTGKGILQDEKGQLTVSRGKENKFGVDFRDIEEAAKGAGIEIDAGQEGIHIEGEAAVKAVSEKLNQLIGDEIKKLDASMKAGTASKVDQNRFNKLTAAQERLSSGSLRDLELLNSGVKVEGGFADNFRSSAQTQIHESLHGAGLRDEAKTEELTQYIDRKKLYSRSDIIAQEAAAMEKSGKDFTVDDVMKQVGAKYGTDERIQRALTGESGATVKSEEVRIEEMSELLRAVQDLKPAGSGGGINLTSGLAMGGESMENKFFILLQALKNVSKSVEGLNKTMHSDVVALTDGLTENATPLEAKIIAEAITEKDKI